MSSIHQDPVFRATPQRVYSALTDAKAFGEMTGAPAEIGAKPGDAFSCFGGMITGRHIEMVPGQRLVQAWRAGNWEQGVYSIVKFDLAANGDATQLSFDHTGFPDGTREHLESGWHKMYWEKLSAFLEKS